MTGFVKSFSDSRSFGFIEADGGQIYVFHVSALKWPLQSLRAGQRVTFEARSGFPRPKAGNVETVEP